jgi:integrase
MARKVIGITRRRSGWRAEIRVRGKLYTKQFEYDTELATMKEWREDQIQLHGGAKAGTFAADVAEYLSRVSAMPSYKQRAKHLALWLDALGANRSRRSITPAEIDQVLQGWLASGLSPVTVRKRRTALQSLFVLLDGKHARNPVRASINPRVPKPESRGIDYRTIARILEVMPEQQDVKPDAVPKPALGRLRVAVLAYTGMSPAALQALTPHDVNFKGASVRLIARKKGRGVAARTIPLTVQGIRALRAFDTANAYGTFAVEALNRSFKRAIKRLKLDPRVRLYDLRHSFGREIYRLTRDLATVARFLGHAEGSTVTARYAEGANLTVDQAAAKAFSVARAQEQRRKSPQKSTENRKPRKHGGLRQAS